MQNVEGLWDSRRSTAPNEKAFAARGSRPAKRPNLIFILADDMGWGDLCCFGSLHIRTPNLDRLAAGGIRFTHAYSASPWCSPARIGLYTGKNPGRFEAGLEEPLATRNETNGIPHGHPTLPSLLRDAGYRTAMFGKWHCGWLPWFSPLKIGFETFFGNLDGAMDYFTHIDTLGLPDLYEGETPIGMNGYYTDLITDRAVDYIKEAASTDQFYMQVNYNSPHWPWEGRGDRDVANRIADDYASRNVPFPMFHSDGGSLAKYGELIETMDEGIGRILDMLDETGRADDTLICFASDNGGERYSFMWPFVGEKGDVTEGGIRVPFIARWPAAFGAGQCSDDYSIFMDWTATFLDAGGTGPDPAFPIDGRSLLPWLLDGDPHPQHDLMWRISSQGALRRGTLKYLLDHRPSARMGNWPMVPGTRHMLFDLSGDGREAANLVRHNPEELRTLRDAYEAAAAWLLPYPPDHRGRPENSPVIRAPRHASPTQPAVSAPD
jgi:arylsulfatase A-like enzyme